jgi:hypothetical protein
MRLFPQSTKRPKWEKKSAPMRGCLTLATTNRNVKFRRNRRLRLRGSRLFQSFDFFLIAFN